MAINKVVYGGKTLIDLTKDDVTPSDLAYGKTAHDKSGAAITGTNKKDSVTTDATATASEILATKTAYVNTVRVTGSMPNIGAQALAIKDLNKKTISTGFHDGSGYAQIDATERAKIVAANIREGVTILGVEGTMSGSEDSKPQTKSVTPSTTTQTILPDEGYNCLSQVTVAAITYSEQTNSAGGTTVTIAG